VFIKIKINKKYTQISNNHFILFFSFVLPNLENCAKKGEKQRGGSEKNKVEGGKDAKKINNPPQNIFVNFF